MNWMNAGQVRNSTRRERNTLEAAGVWGGGALFVTALALCLWWYSFVLGRTQPRAGWPVVLLDLALFSLFALHHSLFARETMKRTVAAVVPERLRRSVYVWTASALLILVCLAWRPIGGELYDVIGWRAAIHGAVQIAGLVLIAESTRTIDPLELAGIRPASDTAGGLQIGGPYRLVRHPLYFGWMLAAFGAAHMTGDRFAFAVISSFYLVIAVPWEERSLRHSFGEAYARYQQNVRWRVIPFIY